MSATSAQCFSCQSRSAGSPRQQFQSQLAFRDQGEPLPCMRAGYAAIRSPILSAPARISTSCGPPGSIRTSISCHLPLRTLIDSLAYQYQTWPLRMSSSASAWESLQSLELRIVGPYIVGTLLQGLATGILATQWYCIVTRRREQCSAKLHSLLFGLLLLNLGSCGANIAVIILSPSRLWILIANLQPPDRMALHSGLGAICDHAHAFLF